jgi:hypothetical protein
MTDAVHTPTNWAAFVMTMIPYLEQAEAALKVNKPLPQRPEMSLSDAATALKAAEPRLIALDAWLKANPGAVTAVLRILAGLQAQGVGQASQLAEIVSGVPGDLVAAEDWLPTAISAMAMFAPAPGKFLGIA